MSFRRFQRRRNASIKGEETEPEKSKRTFLLIENIEARSERSITIDTQLRDEILAKCNLQEQSPLFRLPAELRNTIFELACLPYDDPETKYNNRDFYYRPEHVARHISSTSLLLACRRAWLEANQLPLQYGDHSFWFKDPGRRPKYLDDVYSNEGNRLDRRRTHYPNWTCSC